jgi:predicted nucleic acid-binding protein
MLVGIDTAVFIYLFEDSPEYAQIARSVLLQVQSGSTRAVTSTVTLMEITVKPLQLGDVEVADTYVLLVSRFPNLSVVPIDANAARLAASFRAKYNLRPADALQLGACQQAGTSAFVTNDKTLRRVNEMEIFILDDFRY